MTFMAKKSAAQVECGQMKAHKTPQAIVRNLVRISSAPSGSSARTYNVAGILTQAYQDSACLPGFPVALKADLRACLKVLHALPSQRRDRARFSLASLSLPSNIFSSFQGKESTVLNQFYFTSNDNICQ